MDSSLASYRKVCSRVTLQEKREGFFFSLVDTLSENVDMDLFAKCSTDFDRAKYVANVSWNFIGAQLIYRGKKLEEAVKMRQQGNTFFEKGDLPKALLYYSQSIVQAPVGPELVSVYTNRSALFRKMGEYELAITDAELAISYGAPENTRHKLYERMASCYFATQNYHKAKVILRLAKHFSEKYEKDDAKFAQKLEKLSKAIQSKEAHENEKSDKKAINKNEDKENVSSPKSFKPGKKFTAASNKFDAKFSPGLGRYGFAKHDIAAGEEVLREKPFASCLSPDRMGTFCLYCLQRLKAPIACDTCANVAFCSRECKKLGTVYHQYECRIMSMLIGSGMSINAHLALRMITQSSVEDFKKIIPQLEVNPESILTNADDGTSDTSYLGIYNLGGLEDQRPPEELLQRTIMAVFLVKCLRLVGYFHANLFQNPNPSTDEFHIAALILRNLQVVQFNAYEVSEFLMPEKTNYKKSITSSIGLAIYPTASYLNHSCYPDVARYFIGTTLVATATKSIAANQPICDNYGPNFIKVSRDDRRLKLNGRYWFHCSCEACVNNWETLAKLGVNEQPKTAEQEQALAKLQKMEPIFEEAVKMMESGQPEGALKCLINYVQEAECILSSHKDSSFYPYKTMVLAHQAMNLCYCSLGTVHLAPKVTEDIHKS